MAVCWERRGCDEEMQADCPHTIEPDEKCPARCAYGRCSSPDNAPLSDRLMALDPTVDRSAAQREQCLYCDFFLKRGPRI